MCAQAASRGTSTRDSGQGRPLVYLTRTARKVRGATSRGVRGDSTRPKPLSRPWWPGTARWCRACAAGLLTDPNDVEDAFQATFLVLVRRADAIRVNDSLGGWLYGVARRIAAKARAKSQRRRTTLAMCTMEPAFSGFDPTLAELHSALDEEIERLPGKFRSPLVICHLEGLSHAEAARRLGWPIGTVSGRLSQADGSASTASVIAGDQGLGYLSGLRAGIPDARPAADRRRDARRSPV